MSRLARQDSPIKTRPSRLVYKTLKIMTRLLHQDSTNNDKTFMSRLYKHCQDSPVKTQETMKIIKRQDSTNIIYKYCPDLPVKTRPLKTCLWRLSKKMTKLVYQDFSNTIYKNCQHSPVNTLQTMKRLYKQNIQTLSRLACQDLPAKTTNNDKTCTSRLKKHHL